MKYNTKGSHTKLDCRLCLGPLETQEHLQECPGAGFERRGLKLEEEVDLITFWRRISVKLQGFAMVVRFVILKSTELIPGGEERGKLGCCRKLPCCPARLQSGVAVPG